MYQKIKLLFMTSRPLSWVNTAFPFAATYLFFEPQLNLTFWLGTFFFLVPYNLLMYGVNDVYDYESDLLNPRKGGVEGALIDKRYHRMILAIAYALTAIFAVLLLSLGDSSVLTLTIVLFFVVAYSLKGLRFKEVPFLDSITSSLHFVGPMLYALALVGWPTEALLPVIAFFFWGMGSHSLGAIQDIISDRQASISSIATVLGAKVTWLFSLACYLTSSAIVAWSSFPYGLLIGLGSTIYIINLLPHRKVNDKTSPSTRPAWRRFLWINYLFGFLVTITLILIYLLNHGF